MEEQSKTTEGFVSTCNQPECKCLHEQGLVEFQNADGSFSQMKIADAEKEMKKLENMKKALGEQHA